MKMKRLLFCLFLVCSSGYLVLVFLLSCSLPPRDEKFLEGPEFEVTAVETEVDAFEIAEETKPEAVEEPYEVADLDVAEVDQGETDEFVFDGKIEDDEVFADKIDDEGIGQDEDDDGIDEEVEEEDESVEEDEFGEADLQTEVCEPEKCDGVDNDCNGLTDETFPLLGINCSVGIGECEEQGVFVCDSTSGFVKCSVEPGAEQDEICDELDNDCDGETDNVAAEKLQSDNEHCGECFNPCESLPNAVSVACVSAKCAPIECQPKFWNADGKPENGCECQISSGAVEICDLIDNDCDGVTDEYCDNLVMYLPFDGNWKDKSKYGNNATPYNGAGFTSDAILGQAASFDGVDDYAVVADSVSTDSIKEEFTWFLGVKIVGKTGVIFQKELWQPGFKAQQGSCISGQCFCFKINGTDVICQPIVENNKWFLFTARYKKGEFTVYQNGVLYWQDNVYYPQNVGNNIVISYDSNAGINGIVDEFHFYNKALSDTEIANYYEKIK